MKKIFLLVLILWAGAAYAQQGPHINYLYPAGGQQGNVVKIKVGGLRLLAASDVLFSGSGIEVDILEVPKPKETKKGRKISKNVIEDQDNPEAIYLSVKIARDAKPGMRDLRVVSADGISNRFRFFVGAINELTEAEDLTMDKPMQVNEFPCVINGQIMPGDRDYIRFYATRGQKLVCDVKARVILPFLADAVPGWFQAVVTLYDSKGNEVAYVDDNEFRPDPVVVFDVAKDDTYILQINDSIYRGRDDFVYRITVGQIPFIRSVFPLGGKAGTKTVLQVQGVNLPSGRQDVAFSEKGIMNVSCGVKGFESNAKLLAVGDLNEVSEVKQNDSYAKAQLVKWPVVINGKIEKVGDVDVYKISAKAQQKIVIDVDARLLDSPLDSSIELYDAKFNRLGFNDDFVGKKWYGLVTHHADSNLSYTFKADGDYYVKLADVQNKGGVDFGYRLKLAEPNPDFDLYVYPDNLLIGKGGTGELTVHIHRKDGFNGAVDLMVEGLGAGAKVNHAKLPAKAEQMQFTISLPKNGPVGILRPRVFGQATITRKTVKHQAKPCEDLMQAFLYRHLVETDELLIGRGKDVAFSFTHDFADVVLEVPQGGQAEFAVKVNRTEQAKAMISLAVETISKNVQVRKVSFAPDKNTATVVVAVKKNIPVGYEENIVMTGSMKVGKNIVENVMPAIAVKVVAGK
ncbi:MAG: PPC domain-containing protein [Phycisphaerae bacterium]|nr:PPC domain-containing protein [Phycisphaerae bacterium]